MTAGALGTSCQRVPLACLWQPGCLAGVICGGMTLVILVYLRSFGARGCQPTSFGPRDTRGVTMACPWPWFRSDGRARSWLVDLEPHKNRMHTGKILHSRIEVFSIAVAIRPHSHHAQGVGHHSDPSISEQVAQLALGVDLLGRFILPLLLATSCTEH